MNTDYERVSFTATCAAWCVSEMMSGQGCTATMDYNEFWKHYNQEHAARVPATNTQTLQVCDEPKIVVVRKRILADED